MQYLPPAPYLPNYTLGSLFNANQDLDVVALSSMSMSLTSSVAQLRIVQADLLSSEDTTATFVLRPNGSSPGNSEISFTDISVASARLAIYQSVGPGDYEIVDSLSRMDAQLLTLQAGKIYTLIIQNNVSTTGTAQNPAEGPDVLLHEDDLLAR